MFRPQKPDTAAPQRGRQRLEPWTKAPTLDDIRNVYAEADKSRGSLLEVLIKRPMPPAYILTCQFDQHASEPVWSLYEGEDGSKTMWHYPNGNLEMIWEIICMSLPGGVQSPGPMKPELSPQPAPAAAPAQPMQQGFPQQPYPAPYPQGAPQYPQQQGYPMPPQGYPQQPQPYPAQPYPQGYPQYPQSPPMPQQQYPPQQGWPQGPVQWAQPQPGWGQPYGQPAQQFGQPAPAPAPAGNVPPELKPTDLGAFADLLAKGNSNILLGNLFIEAGVLPEPCVEAALKLQELVRKGQLSNNGAIEALRRSAESGGKLTDDVIAACRAMYPDGARPQDGTNSNANANNSGALDAREVARQIIMLILRAGVVSEADVTTAEGVRRKHGGDVGNILVAAGKIDKSVLEAARRCFPLLRDQKLGMDDAYRIMRQCQSTKQSMDEACAQLGIKL